MGAAIKCYACFGDSKERLPPSDFRAMLDANGEQSPKPDIACLPHCIGTVHNDANGQRNSHGQHSLYNSERRPKINSNDHGGDGQENVDFACMWSSDAEHFNSKAANVAKPTAHQQPIYPGIPNNCPPPAYTGIVGLSGNLTNPSVCSEECTLSL